MDLRRMRKLNHCEQKRGAVIYWMSRDQRIKDNWALIHAANRARESNIPLYVVFGMVPGFLGAAWRQYHFMIEGLKTVENECKELGIGFHLMLGDPGKTVPHFINKINAGLLVTDFDPLRIKQKWLKEVVDGIDIPLEQVDTHNIVPCWMVSQKQEYAAFTIRKKIHKFLPDFLDDFSPIKPLKQKISSDPTDWNAVAESVTADRSIKPVDGLIPGTTAGMKLLNDFIENTLEFYGEERNDPNKDAQSNLSPYFHFGQIAPQRAAFEAREQPAAGTEDFIEELVIRRELSDNYCFYQPKYDSTEAFPDWAQKTLDDHRNDPREYLYDLYTFENAETHDPLWNAAQLEMVLTGKMHGYMRMYWAKKILQWTDTPETAMKIAITLNDKYELDGRDPNGYSGIAWSIGGIHDRAWPGRPVFGKIRYMSYNGCKSKFSVKRYIESIENLVS